MKIQFLGAARTVTGSCYMIEAAGRRFSVDCGMHQGNDEIDKRNWDMSVYDPKNMDFVLLTHAHIDHSGLLPRVVSNGFENPIYATEPTADLLEIMLLDSAHIQEMEAEWENRKRRRQRKQLVEPLYVQKDALATQKLFSPVTYNKPFSPAEGITVTYRDAGHILGSSFLEIAVEENGDRYRLVFSGDLGRPDQLLIRDPSDPNPTDYLFVESTYGDRNHKDEATSRDELAQAIAYSHSKGEKVIIPAFAVERTQEIIYSLFLLSKEGKLPPEMPVYVDSPMAIKATEVFRKHPEFFDEETQALLANGDNPLDLPNLRFTPSTQESQAINESREPAVVISASGMCNAGRIKHHLRHNLWRKGASVVFVGFQAMGTPGRRIVDGAKSIRLFGENVSINAKIFTIGGFSAHAGQSQIMDWLGGFDNPNMEVFLVHGEHKAQKTLAGLIQERYNYTVHIPGYLEEELIKPPKGVERVAPDLAITQPAVNWDYVLNEAESKLAAIRAQLDQVKAKPWTYQTDYRDRLLEIAGDLAGLVSEI